MERDEESSLKARYWDMYWKMVEGVKAKKQEVAPVIESLDVLKKGAIFMVDNNMDKHL